MGTGGIKGASAGVGKGVLDADGGAEEKAFATEITKGTEPTQEADGFENEEQEIKHEEEGKEHGQEGAEERVARRGGAQHTGDGDGIRPPED